MHTHKVALLTTVCTTCLRILLAHSCLYYYLLCLQYTVLHIEFYIYIFLFCTFFSHTYIYVYSLVFVFHIIALSMERTWLTFYCWLYSVIVYVKNKYFTFWSYILFYKIILMSLLSLLINWKNKLTGFNLLNSISFQFIFNFTFIKLVLMYPVSSFEFNLNSEIKKAFSN